MTQARQTRIFRIGTAAIPIEAAIGLVSVILATQFLPRQAPREPCYLDVEYFAYAGVILSIGLPYMHMLIFGWSKPQRLFGLMMAIAVFAVRFHPWRIILDSSWSELW